MDHTITIDEGQRQMLLMALAHLSIERPGFDYCLSEIALKIDNRTAKARPELYDQFRALRANWIKGETGPERYMRDPLFHATVTSLCILRSPASDIFTPEAIREAVIETLFQFTLDKLPAVRNWTHPEQDPPV